MLYVVRHGQSSFNYNNLICGITNAPLTEAGKEQARLTGERLKGIKFDRVYVSPLDRARDTAQIILQINGSKATPKVDARIIERDAGLMEGEQREADIGGYPSWRPDFDCEKYLYETRQSVVARVKDFLDELGDAYKTENVLIVAHNGIVRAFRYLFEGFSYDEDWIHYGVENAGFVCYE